MKIGKYDFFLFVKKEKEIRSRDGELHFRRWALFHAPWFKLYLHKIYQSDKDEDPHDHPWDFTSLICDGGYIEKTPSGLRFCFCGDIVRHKAEDLHQIQLFRPTTTLVLVGSYRRPNWGFGTKDGWVDSQTYRKNKNAKKEDIKT